MNQTTGKNPLGLRIIGGFKLMTGILLMGLGIGLFHKLQGDPGLQAEHIVSSLKLDPGNHYIHAILEKVSGATPRQLEAIRIGTFLYALLYLVEGVGLLLHKHWAEYFTVIATGSLIPLEIYEVWEKTNLIRVSLLLINSAIVAYLVWQLRRTRNEKAGAATAPA